MGKYAVRKLIKRMIVIMSITIFIITSICSCGSSNTPSDVSGEIESIGMLGTDCFIDNLNNELKGKQITVCATFWSKRGDSYSYLFTYKEQQEDGSVRVANICVKDDTSDSSLTILDNVSYKDEIAVKITGMFDRIEYKKVNNETATFCYITASDTEILESDSIEAKSATGKYYYLGNTIPFANGVTYTVVDVGKYTDVTNTYVYVEMDVNNNSDEEIIINANDAQFYGDDYSLDTGFPQNANNFLNTVVSKGRKACGRFYAECPNYDNYSKIEVELGDAIIVIKENSFSNNDDVQDIANAGNSSERLEDIDYEYIYGGVMDGVLSEVSEKGGDVDWLNYALYDMDKDRFLELIVQSGTCDADLVYKIFSTDGTSCFSLGEIGGDASLYECSNGAGFYTYSGQMEYEVIEHVTVENGSLVEECIFEGENTTGKKFEELKTEITMHFLKDGLIW